MSGKEVRRVLLRPAQHSSADLFFAPKRVTTELSARNWRVSIRRRRPLSILLQCSTVDRGVIDLIDQLVLQTADMETADQRVTFPLFAGHVKGVSLKSLGKSTKHRGDSHVKLKGHHDVKV